MDKIHNAFDNIKADDRLKESTKQYLLEKHSHKKMFPQDPLFRKVPVFCIIIAFIILTGGYSWFYKPVSYISIDINPSIELALNRFDRVISVTAYNPEGEKIIKELSLKGSLYTSAINIITENKNMQAYFTDKTGIIFTIATGHSHENNITTGVNSCCGHAGHNSQSVNASMDIVEEAHENGVSLGRYYAYLQLLQYNNTITIDEIKDMDMDIIYNMICGHGQASDGKDSHHTSHEGHHHEEIH